MRYERLNAVLELLAENDHMSVNELADRLAVSTATVRRDLDHLSAQQLLTRTRGGAVSSGVADLPIKYKSAQRANEKERIGSLSASLVKPGMTVGMNGGTTVSETAQALAQRADLVHHTYDSRLTVVTNAVNIANLLTVRQHIKLVVAGGVARPQSNELIGPIAYDVISQLNLDLVFLGVDGVALGYGATTHDEGEASINGVLASRAKQVVVVGDSSKIGKSAFVRICPLEDIDVLVTDEDADPEAVAELTAAGVEVLLA